MTGLLSGLRVIELGGIGPGPHAAMLLSDLGADVVRIERPHGGLQITPPGTRDWLLRGRRSVAADLKNPDGLAVARELIDQADILIEGFRPGVAERLGIGPDECHRTNPRLIYGRMTGWGQSGPRAQQPGHDINYLALTGVLHAIGPSEAPVPPLNLVGDFGGGSAYLVIGVLAALHERDRSGAGQVIDAAIVDGVTSLAQGTRAAAAAGTWTDAREQNLLDGGAPFYRTYRCADGGFVAVGALEPQFYEALLQGLGLTGESLPDQHDRAAWPRLRARFAEIFASRTRAEWSADFAGSDACVTPVLTLAEAGEDSHLAARATVTEVDEVVQAAPAPRFSRSDPPLLSPPPEPGEHTDEVRWDWKIARKTDLVQPTEGGPDGDVL